MPKETFQTLSANPRVITLVSLSDGYSFEFLDDGGAIIDNEVHPNGRRQGLLRQLLKKTRDGKPCYILSKEVDGMYNGDPLASAPAMNVEWKKIIAANVKERARKHSAAEAIGKAEATKFANAVKGAVVEALGDVGAPKTPKASVS